MPSFIVVTGGCRPGETVQAQHLDPGPTGWPNPKSSTPVHIRLAPEQERVLFVDDERREIVSSTGQNGQTTYLITGSSKTLRNAERRRQLERAAMLLHQLRDAILPLQSGSAAPSLVTEGLGTLDQWLALERSRAAEKPYRQLPTGSLDNEGRPIVEIRKDTR